MGSSLAVTPRRAAPPSRGLLFRTASGAGRTPARRAASRAYQRERGPLCLVGLASLRSPATAIAWSSARSNIITTASADPGGTVGLWDISAASAELSLDKGGGGDATAFARCVGLFETGAPVRAMRHSPLGDGIVTVAAEGESARSVRLWATPDSLGPFSDGADAGGAVQVQGPTAATQLSSGARVAADVGDLRREWAGHDTRVVAFDWRVRGEADVQLVSWARKQLRVWPADGERAAVKTAARGGGRSFPVSSAAPRVVELLAQQRDNESRQRLRPRASFLANAASSSSSSSQRRRLARGGRPPTSGSSPSLSSSSKWTMNSDASSGLSHDVLQDEFDEAARHIADDVLSGEGDFRVFEVQEAVAARRIFSVAVLDRDAPALDGATDQMIVALAFAFPPAYPSGTSDGVVQVQMRPGGTLAQHPRSRLLSRVQERALSCVRMRRPVLGACLEEIARCVASLPKHSRLQQQRAKGASSSGVGHGRGGLLGGDLGRRAARQGRFIVPSPPPVLVSFGGNGMLLCVHAWRSVRRDVVLTTGAHGAASILEGGVPAPPLIGVRHRNRRTVFTVDPEELGQSPSKSSSDNLAALDGLSKNPADDGGERIGASESVSSGAVGKEVPRAQQQQQQQTLAWPRTFGELTRLRDARRLGIAARGKHQPPSSGATALLSASEVANAANAVGGVGLSIDAMMNGASVPFRLGASAQLEVTRPEAVDAKVRRLPAAGARAESAAAAAPLYAYQSADWATLGTRSLPRFTAESGNGQLSGEQLDASRAVNCDVLIWHLAALFAPGHNDALRTAENSASHDRRLRSAIAIALRRKPWATSSIEAAFNAPRTLARASPHVATASQIVFAQPPLVTTYELRRSAALPTRAALCRSNGIAAARVQRPDLHRTWDLLAAVASAADGGCSMVEDEHERGVHGVGVGGGEDGGAAAAAKRERRRARRELEHDGGEAKGEGDGGIGSLMSLARHPVGERLIQRVLAPYARSADVQTVATAAAVLAASTKAAAVEVEVEVATATAATATAAAIATKASLQRRGPKPAARNADDSIATFAAQRYAPHINAYADALYRAGAFSERLEVLQTLPSQQSGNEVSPLLRVDASPSPRRAPARFEYCAALRGQTNSPARKLAQKRVDAAAVPASPSQARRGEVEASWSARKPLRARSGSSVNEVDAVVCSVCNGRVRGMWTNCDVCGHGGHLRCVAEHFAKSTMCPAACGCCCGSRDDDRDGLRGGGGALGSASAAALGASASAQGEVASGGYAVDSEW